MPPVSPVSASHRYRKRPVVIEAVRFQLREYADAPSLGFGALPPDWLRDAISGNAVTFAFESEDYWYFVVDTLEGQMRGGPDDWIIRGVEGELYPCASRIFTATYEAAE